MFHPDHSALDSLFAKDMQFIIPEYQRPYSWQAEGKNDRNNQINQMWDDLWTFFREMDADKEYFLGSMVIIERGLRKLEVVDGQQRLTSLVLLFSAMRCFLRRCLAFEGDQALDDELGRYVQRAIDKLGEFVYNEQGIGLTPELKVKIARSAGYDFDAALEASAACEERTAFEAGRRDRDQKFDEIARRYFDNRDYFIDRLTKTFLDVEGKFGVDEFQEFNRFFSFLLTRVAIVLIKTADFETAYSIFEILNNRGLPLSNTDLFRNFVINKFAEKTKIDGATAWYQLEEDFVLGEDFTARWVESKTGSKQRQSAFNGIQRLYEDEGSYKSTPIKTKVEVFYADLKRDLRYYSQIVEPEDRIDDARVRNSTRFIAALGNLRYSSTLLLALFRHYRYDGSVASEAMLGLMKAYERYALSIWLHPGKRFSSAPIYQAVRELRAGKPAEAAELFALDDEEMRKLAERVDGPIENSVGKVLLAAYVWATEEGADDVVMQRLELSRSTLEHIIPINPAEGTNWESDLSTQFREEFTLRVGNMTLLTSKMNSRAKNSDFSKKKKVYAKTLLGITRELVSLDTVSEDFIRQRHARIVKALLTRWSLPSG
ncbi:MAG: DUF262 domain-containing HNH endonuclease family protein [Myxococcota bacterium]